MDEKDRAILEILRKDSKLSTRKISKKTRIAITTIHHRIKKLVSSGLIKNYTINIDYSKIGRDIIAFILAKLDYKKGETGEKNQQNILNKILSLENIEDVCYITGEYDMLIKGRFRNIKEMNNTIIKKIRKFKEIQSTMTMVELHD